MAFKLLNEVTAVGASGAVKVGNCFTQHRLDVSFKSLAAVKISALTISLQGSHTNSDANTGIISNPSLAVGSTAEKFAFGAFDYCINKVSYHKAADAVGIAFTSAHAVTAEKYGVVNLYINAAGTWTSLVPSATQAYDTAAAAHAAGDLISPSPLLCYVGRILINAETGNDWNANTDDLTDGSDLTTATFLSNTSTFTDLTSYVFSAGDITEQRATIYLQDAGAKYVRCYLSTLTGTGEVTAIYQAMKN